MSTVGTRGAQEALYKAKQDPLEFLDRHASGDWGEMCAEDKHQNDLSVKKDMLIVVSFLSRENHRIFYAYPAHLAAEHGRIEVENLIIGHVIPASTVRGAVKHFVIKPTSKRTPL